MCSPCAKHPHQALVGVCAACLRERLALSMSNLGQLGGGGGGEAESSANNEALGSSIIVSERIGNGSPSKRALSYYLENIQGVSSNCNVHARSHRETMSTSDGIYQGNSFYASHHYVAKGPPFTKEKPILLSDVFSSKGRTFSWFSALFSKREEKQKADSREGSIAPWRECDYKESGCEGTCYDQHETCTHSLSFQAPSNWQQLSSWRKKPTRSPSMLSSQSTRSPFRLPPLLSSPHSTRSPLILLPPLSSQSTRSPLKLSPLLSYPRSPLKLSSLLSSKPRIIACGVNSHEAQIVSSQIEEDQRSGHGIPSEQSKKGIWFGIFLRNKWVVRVKRHFAKKKKQEDAESVRTSSAKESDYGRHSQIQYSVQARHSQNHSWFMEKKHFHQNQRASMLNRPFIRAGAGREGELQRCGREYAGWQSYSSFNGLPVRHRYPSVDSAELLRFYLTPCKLRSHHYYY